MRIVCPLRLKSAGVKVYYSYLSYKAESAATNFIQIDPRDTTQMCSNCGTIVKKSLSERVHECPYCGFVADRDYNAAVNIHRVGWNSPCTGETMRLHHITVVQILSMIAGKPRPRVRGNSRTYLPQNGQRCTSKTARARRAPNNRGIRCRTAPRFFMLMPATVQRSR